MSPQRAPHGCPGCGVATSDPGRCARCRGVRNRQIDERRGSASARGYDTAWERARTRHLGREPLCRFCAERGRVESATEVDHIVSIVDAPALRLTDSNLRSLCKSCHSGRTMRDQVPRRRE